jgi:hypothetical protein
MTSAIVALALAVLALTFLVLILIGAQRDALDTAPATPLAGFARRFLGVYVRRPDSDQLTDQHLRVRGGGTR